jgi:hypothetical protein
MKQSTRFFTVITCLLTCSAVLSSVTLQQITAKADESVEDAYQEIEDDYDDYDEDEEADSYESYEYDDWYYHYLDDGTIEVNFCDRNLESEETTFIEIPSEIDGVPVTSLGKNLFSGYYLTDIIIPDSVTNIGYSALSCYGLASISLPDGLVTIGERAFNGSYLKEITIPASVTSIGEDAFSGCSNLESITVDPQNTAYASQDGALFTHDMTTLIRYPVAKTDTSYQIPDTVTTIGSCAFQSSASLSEVTIPDSVVTIGDMAFCWCAALKEIVIPKSVEKLGGGMFESCYALESAQILANITEGDFNYCDVGAHHNDAMGNVCLFAGCTSLKTVTIPNGMKTFSAYDFYGCSNLTDIYYYGTEEEWNAIKIVDGTDLLAEAGANPTVHFVTSSADTLTGDPNGDSIISVEDAVIALTMYAQASAGLELDFTESQITAADVNGDGVVTVEDAVYILTYYAKQAAGLEVSWEELIA